MLIAGMHNTFAGVMSANAAAAGRPAPSAARMNNTGHNRTENMVKNTNRNTDDEEAAMIDRLRNSKTRAEIDDRMRGSHSGVCWAMRKASYRELRIIALMAEEFGDPEIFIESDCAAEHVAETLASNLKSNYGEEHTEQETLNSMFPLVALRDSPIFVAAFVKSAAEVWKEVAQEVG